MVIHAECKMDIQSLLKTIKAKISDQSTVDRSHLSISLIRFVWKSLKISPQKPSRNSEKLFFPPQRFLLEQIPLHPWLAFSTWYTQDHNVFVLAETFVFYPLSCEYSTHVGPELEFFFNLIWFPQNKNQHSSSCSCLVVWTDQSPSAMLHYKNCT